MPLTKTDLIAAVAAHTDYTSKDVAAVLSGIEDVVVANVAKGEKVVITVDRYGNTSSASIPIALSETYAAGKLHDGDVIVFVGFGGGLSWGAVAWRCSART